MAAKNYWTSKAGKQATTAAAQSDAAGAMRVSPATRGRPESLPDTFGIGATLGSAPLRGPLAGSASVMPAKQLSSSGTGYGSFRNTPTNNVLSGGSLTAGTGGRGQILYDNKYTKDR